MCKINKIGRGGEGGKAASSQMTSEKNGITIENFQIVCLAAFWVPGGNDKWQ